MFNLFHIPEIVDKKFTVNLVTDVHTKSQSLEEKREVAISRLGTKWLLHPTNKIQKK